MGDKSRAPKFRPEEIRALLRAGLERQSELRRAAEEIADESVDLRRALAKLRARL